MSLHRVFSNAAERARRHGVAKAGLHLSLSALNKLVEVRILKAVCVEEPAEGFDSPPRFTVCVLSEAQLRDFASDPAYELSHGFLDRALAKGDQCFAVLDGPRLAAYGWYAFSPTPIGIDDLRVRFGRDFVYMYKGFTHDAYRGQRLHAIGMTAALRHYLGRGYKGLVSYVEATNFDSLRSCYRMGYFVFGTVWIAKAPGGYRVLASPGCRRYGFEVVHVSGTGPLQPSVNKGF